MQEATGGPVGVAYVDQGYTGEQPRQDAADEGIELCVVKLPKAKKEFVLLSKRSVVERSFAWASRFRRLARDYERLPDGAGGPALRRVHLPDARPIARLPDALRWLGQSA